MAIMNKENGIDWEIAFTWLICHLGDFLDPINKEHVSFDELLLEHEKYRSGENTLYYLCAHPLVKASQSLVPNHFNYCIKGTCATKLSSYHFCQIMVGQAQFLHNYTNYSLISLLKWKTTANKYWYLILNKLLRKHSTKSTIWRQTKNKI